MKGAWKLFGYKYSASVQENLYTSYVAKATVVNQSIPWGDKIREELKFCTPTATFPYLETPDGFLSETSAINQYIAQVFKPSLLGKTDFEIAQVRQWNEFSSLEIWRAAGPVIFSLLGYLPYSKDAANAAFAKAKDHLSFLNNQLENKEYIIGDDITLADIVLFSALRFWYKFVFVEEMREKLFPNITRWMKKLSTTEEAIKAYGILYFCKVPIQPPAVDEENSQIVDVNFSHYDSLPATTFNLDEFKKLFNSTEKALACNYLRDNFDSNGFSLWFFHYNKNPMEAKVLSKSLEISKTILGKLNDGMKKYSFSSLGVYGEEGNYEIRGVWMFRGEEIPEEIQLHPCFQHFAVWRLDNNQVSDRKLVEDFWFLTKENEIVEDLKVQDVSYFQ